MEDETREEDTMAYRAALKAAKKDLRGVMKKKLSAISKESIDTQSSFSTHLRIMQLTDIRFHCFSECNKLQAISGRKAGWNLPLYASS
jgi:hypothetical protein